MTPGETPVDFLEPQFTMQEACDVSGINAVTLRNWLARETLPVGEKNSRLGRWMFTGIDIMKLRIVSDLITLAKMDPSATLPILELVEDRFFNFRASNSDGSRPDTRLILHLNMEGEGIAITTATWAGETYNLPSEKRGGKNQWTRRAHLIVPIDLAIFDVLNSLYSLLGLEPDKE